MSDRTFSLSGGRACLGDREPLAAYLEPDLHTERLRPCSRPRVYESHARRTGRRPSVMCQP